MGQAKKDLERQEQNEAIKESILIQKGYTKCYRCGKLFIAKSEDDTVCPDCWGELMKD